MIRICAWCGANLGETEPYEDDSTTHGICEPCFAQRRVWSAQRLSLDALFGSPWLDEKEEAAHAPAKAAASKV